MIHVKPVSEEELELMKIYGITEEQKPQYVFQGYKYDRHTDAIKFAKKNMSAESETSPSSAE